MRNFCIGLFLCFSNFMSFSSCSSGKREIVDINEDGSKIEYKLNKEGRIEGIVKHYYPNKNLKNEFTILNDKKDGIEKFYYDNGHLAQKRSWINGHLIGDVFEYDKSGKISTHMFYTLRDTNGLTFLRQFDSLGDIKKEEGLLPVWITFNQRSFRVNDTIEVLIFASTSNEFKFNFSIQECLKNNNCNSLVSQQNIEEKGEQIFVKKSIFKHVAKTDKPFYWIVNVEMEEKRNQKLKTYTDTLFFNIK